MSLKIDDNLTLEGKSNNGLFAGGSDNLIFEIAGFDNSKIFTDLSLLHKVFLFCIKAQTAFLATITLYHREVNQRVI
ncbi:hypothetical protein [Muribaculum intestinale]|nr:hypothetical protein [Muribaculum intestinale]